ncbi:MAG TPA: phage tail protein I [Croceibacterium sp.]|nr:phage tail protein I [Croceibacterium sp.]
MTASLLPPNVTAAERALEGAAARLEDVPVPIRALWNPATCPAFLLPWLAWSLSIDIWDSAWSEPEKRAAIAGAIEAQRRKGTPASLRAVLDRFDPMLRLVEWFEDRDVLDPYTFRLEIPLSAETEVAYDEALVTALLRDIAAVKPLRAHMEAVHALRLRAGAYLISGAALAGFERFDADVDLDAPLDPIWAGYLQTENGEPVADPDGAFLETA